MYGANGRKTTAGGTLPGMGSNTFPKLLSVDEAAVELGISARRVRQLCEQGRITGAQQVSGVWVIPSPAHREPPRRARSTA